MSGEVLLFCVFPMAIFIWVMALRGIANPGRRKVPAVTRRSIIPTKVRAYVYKRDGFRCVYCGGKHNLQLDHVFPHSRGGPDEPHNLVAACKTCNIRKGARTPEQAGMRLYSNRWRITS